MWHCFCGISCALQGIKAMTSEFWGKVLRQRLSFPTACPLHGVFMSETAVKFARLSDMDLRLGHDLAGKVIEMLVRANSLA
jgi:hypothetical protein